MGGISTINLMGGLLLLYQDYPICSMVLEYVYLFWGGHKSRVNVDKSSSTWFASGYLPKPKELLVPCEILGHLGG